MQTTFCELRTKAVINVLDGRDLGHCTDIVIDCSCGKILGLIVPGETYVFKIFKPNDEIFIPWHNICKIGEDVILVELFQRGGCYSGCGVGKLDVNKEITEPEHYEAYNDNYNSHNDHNNQYNYNI